MYCPVCKSSLESSSSLRRFLISFADKAEDIAFGSLDKSQISGIEAEKGEYINVYPKGKHNKTRDIKNMLNDIGSEQCLSIGQNRAIVVLPARYCNKCKLAIPITSDMNQEDLFGAH